MKKSIKRPLVILLFVVLLSTVVFTPSVSAAENLPTVWVKVYRIQAVDAIENVLESEADWRYKITVSNGETLTTREFKCSPNKDDVILDRADSFTDIENQDVFVSIALYEDDLVSSETADISSSGQSFSGTYNLISNELGGEASLWRENTIKRQAIMTEVRKQTKMTQICGSRFSITMTLLPPMLAKTKPFTPEKK
jgi:hypothetical protein